MEMLVKFVSNKEASIDKGKCKHKQNKPKQKCFPKGADDKMQRKIWNFEREDKGKQ